MKELGSDYAVGDKLVTNYDEMIVRQIQQFNNETRLTIGSRAMMDLQFQVVITFDGKVTGIEPGARCAITTQLEGEEVGHPMINAVTQVLAEKKRRPWEWPGPEKTKRRGPTMRGRL